MPAPCELQRRLSPTLFALASLALIAACGRASTAPAATAYAGVKIIHGHVAVAQEWIVGLKGGYAFRPRRIRISTGTTVIWINRSDRLQAVSGSVGGWGSDVLRSNQGYKRRFDRPGRYPYTSPLHARMSGLIVVH